MSFKSWMRRASDDELRSKKKDIQDSTDWSSGSILDGDFDNILKKLDSIDEELNNRSWDRCRSEICSSSYGVHREHGWYLPNDD